MVADDKSNKAEKTAVTYIRLSSAWQASSEKLSRFYNYMQEGAQALDAQIIHRYEDIGTSSDSEGQIRMQELLKYLSENQVDYVIVPNFSMLSRETMKMYNLAEKIEQSGAKLVSPSGEEATLPMYKELAASACRVIDSGGKAEYSICQICHEQMTPEYGCSIDIIFCNGRSFDRIKVGDELDFNPDMDDRDVCHDCNAGLGQYHHWNCDAERCPFCHGQLIGCDCDVKVLMKQEA